MSLEVTNYKRSDKCFICKGELTTSSYAFTYREDMDYTVGVEPVVITCYQTSVCTRCASNMDEAKILNDKKWEELDESYEGGLNSTAL